MKKENLADEQVIYEKPKLKRLEILTDGLLLQSSELEITDEETDTFG